MLVKSPLKIQPENQSVSQSVSQSGFLLIISSGEVRLDDDDCLIGVSDKFSSLFDAPECMVF